MRSFSTEDILEKLASENSQERRMALGVIVLTPLPEFVADVIRTLQQDTDNTVRERAAWVLDQLGSPLAMSVLVDALEDECYGVRSCASWALVRMGEPVVTSVTSVLRSGSDEAREMAYLVLLRVNSPLARDAVRRYWKQN